MPGYLEIVLSVVVVGVVLFVCYVAYVKGQENKRLREMAVAHAYEIGNLRRDLRKSPLILFPLSVLPLRPSSSSKYSADPLEQRRPSTMPSTTR